jgi:hypothetical protein
MTKPLHVGHSPRNGLFAAFLAQRGFTANPEVFEHKQGFFEVFNGPGTYDAAGIFDTWANPLDLIDPGFGAKQFPCCGSAHPAIAMMLTLQATYNLTPNQVETYAKLEDIPWEGIDLVIESATEDLTLKQKLFLQRDGLVRPESPLTSNTSGLPIGELGKALKNRSRVAGLHFFMPAHFAVTTLQLQMQTTLRVPARWLQSEP